MFNNLTHLIGNIKKNRRAIFLVIASMVVAITTYTLILPAFTLEKETADELTETLEEAITSKKDSKLLYSNTFIKTSIIFSVSLEVYFSIFYLIKCRSSNSYHDENYE